LLQNYGQNFCLNLTVEKEVKTWTYAGCTLHTIQSSTQNNKYQVSRKHSCFSWWWAHSRPKHVEIDKYTKKKLCTKLVLFTKCQNMFWNFSDFFFKCLQTDRVSELLVP